VFFTRSRMLVAMKEFFDRDALKYVLGFVVVFAFRLIPFRPPNVEPVMATMMPFAQRYGALSGFAFAALSILLFDIVTMHVGVWTILTALTYGIIGAAAHFYFKRREARAGNYVTFAIVGTLFYDAVTGLTIGPLLWGQSFMVALVGQIPFTLLHLAGSVTFAFFLSPLIHRWVVQNEQVAFSSLYRRLRTNG
jgi:uncharacterized membrane protein